METVDVFLLSSLWEGFGYVLVEAMASAKPIVALNSSSEPEIVQDGKTGFIVDDLTSFVDKIEILAEEKDLGLEFGKNGRMRVEEKFDISITFENFKKILRQ
jgi:glycosyltransferase involved in cell wall biosynthesis